MSKKLLKGNEAIGEAAIRAGCRYFFGYPITPQNELPAYMSRRLPEVGGVFLQAESEVAAINMVYGAAGAGARVMTSSSSPGISLKQEGISYIAGADLPCVIVNIMRGGPGLGGIQPAQSDYFQSTRGGGHGDYRVIVFAPSTVAEAFQLTMEAFDLADRYRMPAMILGDGILGQMMEPVDLPDEELQPVSDLKKKEWAVGPDRDRGKNIITSLCLDTPELERQNWRRYERYQEIAQKHIKVETHHIQDAELIVVAYGSAARISLGAVKEARKRGLPVGLFRPVSLWPFPAAPLGELASGVDSLLTVEMSTGQMHEDVRLAVGDRARLEFLGRTGGMVPEVDEILEKIDQIVSGGGGRNERESAQKR